MTESKTWRDCCDTSCSGIRETNRSRIYSSSIYFQQIPNSRLLSRDDEAALFGVAEVSDARVRELSGRFLFMSRMCIRELDRLASGDERFDRLVADGYPGGSAAYKKSIPELRRLLEDAEDRLYGASVMRMSILDGSCHESLIDNADRMLEEARSVMSSRLRELKFRHEVVEALCEAAYDDIYRPYMKWRVNLENSSPGGEDEVEAREHMGSIEALFGMSPDEFIKSFDELRRAMSAAASVRSKIVEFNLRLVISNARKYANRGIEFMDLVQEGNVGLMTAARKFSLSKGVKFSTYATWWIRKMMSRAITNQSRTVRPPAHMVEMLGKLGNADRELLQRLGRNPTNAEVAAHMKISEDKIADLRQIQQRTISLDSAVWEGDDTTYCDMVMDERISPAEDAGLNMVCDDVRHALRCLTDRELKVVSLRYGLEDGNCLSLEDLGKMFNVSREHIRQIEMSAMEKLKKSGELKSIAAMLSGG